MASLWGHIDEGMVFMMYAIWTLFNIFKENIKDGGSTKHSKAQISYDITIRGRAIPMEIFLKMFFTIGGAMFELKHLHIFGDDGRFRSVTTMQHVSIYALFMLHSIVDLLRYYKVLIIPGMAYLMLSLTFFWYGVIFYFHNKMEDSDPLLDIVHSMGTAWCLLVSVSILCEFRSEDSFVPRYCRALFVLGLGTWFIHTPFFLYSSSTFPGKDPNPLWDRHDPQNVQVIATLFGVHLCVNTTATVVMYAVMKCVMARSLRDKKSMFVLESPSASRRYKAEKDAESGYALLCAEEEAEDDI